MINEATEGAKQVKLCISIKLHNEHDVIKQTILIVSFFIELVITNILIPSQLGREPVWPTVLCVGQAGWQGHISIKSSQEKGLQYFSVLL